MVSETQHTPGPWKFDRWVTSQADTDILLDYYNPDLGTPVKIASCEDYWVGPEEAKANARLIAAAPDLLAACEAVISAGESENLPTTVYDAVESAIAKANGEGE